ncbi:hypothetical protein D3C84_957460 [compost metagenome]
MPAWAVIAERHVPVRQLLLLAGRHHGRHQLVDQTADLVDAHRQMHLGRGDRQLGQEVQAFDQQRGFALVHPRGQQIAERFIAGGARYDLATNNVPGRFADDGGMRVEIQ